MSQSEEPAILPFWAHTPKASWLEVDWQEWERRGRPRVPRDMELRPPPEREMGNSPVIPPPGPASAVNSLFPRASRRDAGARSRAVDRLLEKHGIR